MGEISIYATVTFYTILIVFASMWGLNSQVEEDVLSFPEYPSFSFLDDLGILGGIFGLILGAIPFLFLVGSYIFSVLKFTFADFIPAWLSTIIFLPLVFVLAYEFIARHFRGS
jgi:hypothetical protein